MTSVEFCYWLQGLFELADPASLNTEQTRLIKAHLNMVFFPTFIHCFFNGLAYAGLPDLEEEICCTNWHKKHDQENNWHYSPDRIFDKVLFCRHYLVFSE